jgi:transcriptional regulator of acetoin/glycerol metabolism
MSLAAAPATEDHPAPSRGLASGGRECLVPAFPGGSALPIPAGAETIGRSWLEERGHLDSQVSTRHFRFSRPGGALHLEDAESRNGTWVNGVRLGRGERVPVVDGALLRVGNSIFVYRAELMGELTSASPLGPLIGPFGLRSLAAALEFLETRPTTNVLVEGETGTGKELIAAELHRRLRPGRAYAPVNVAGIALGVFESHLFGHAAGAFSGAAKPSRGVVVAHDGGTVFLDEIGELPVEMQPKLLRLLDNREVQPVGAERTRTVDVLLVAATNRALETMEQEGRFRRDLLARFSGARIEVPPLRERVEDIFAIAQALFARRGATLTPRDIEVEAIERLLLHDFRANVRELFGVLERVTALAAGRGLPTWAMLRVLGPSPIAGSGQLVLEDVRAALTSCGNNETEAARRLGVSRGKLRRFLATMRS